MVTTRSFMLVLVASLLGGCIGGFKSPGADERMLRVPPPNSLTFWGHASVFLDLDGFGIVTDPVFEGWYSPLSKRKIPVPPEPALARIRLVLITHAHRDHLSPETLSRLPSTATILCPEPAAGELGRLESEVVAMRPGDSRSFAGGSVTAVLADHPGGRYSLDAEPDGRALGYVVTVPRGILYFSGDTRYFAGLKTIGSRHRPDVAVLNINAHLNSDHAVRAIEDIGARVVVPVHFGAYTGRNDSRSREWLREIQARLPERLMMVDVGESIPLAELLERGRGSP
jgi:L-ascorbate metabolism protein UlaG (beta-lactamase superfamily)